MEQGRGGGGRSKARREEEVQCKGSAMERGAVE